MRVYLAGRGSNGLLTFAVCDGPMTFWFDTNDSGEVIGGMALVEPYASKAAAKAKAILAKR